MRSNPPPLWLRPPIFWGLVLYVVFGVLWILSSDSLLFALGLSAEAAARFATGKGLLFVLLSAGWALLMLRMAASTPAAEAVDPAPAAAAGLDRWMLAIGLLVPLIGGAVYALQAHKLEADTGRSLQAMAELRAQQLSRTLHEWHADAVIFGVDETLLAVLSDKVPDDAQTALTRRLELLTEGYGYSRIEVFDAQDRSVLVHGELLTALGKSDELDQLLLLQTTAPGSEGSLPVHSYLRSTGDGLQLQVVVTLVDQGLILGRAEFWQPMTRLLAGLGSDSSRLFPSEEIVLGSRLNDHVVIVAQRWSESSGRARLLRHPASSTLPIDRALSLGTAGQVEGVDYRGNEVLAGHAPVEGSAWQLLSKVDNADLRDSLLPTIGWIIAVLVLTLGLLAISLSTLWSRQRQVEALQAQTRTAALDRLITQFFGMPFVGIAFTSPSSGRWERFNDRLCEILGYLRPELDNLTWAEVTHPEDLQRDLDQLERVLQDESDGYAMQKRFIRKDGSLVHAYIDVRCLRREDRSVEVFIATIDDISEDVRARKALVDSKQRLEKVVAESPNPTLVLNEDGQIRLLSRSWCELSGYRAEQLTSIDDWLRLVRSDAVVPHVRAHIQTLFDATGRVDEGDFPVRCADGSDRIWAFSSVPLGPAPDGRREIVSTAIDVTTQRRAVSELKASERLYRQMFEDNAICMYTFDAASLRILEVNNAMETSYGWTREQLLTMSIEQLRPKTEFGSLHQAIARMRRDRLNRPGVFTHRRRDGSLLRVDIICHALTHADVEAWLVMAVDVTEREQYVKKLEHASASILAVVTTMVEMRDPYTAGHEERVGQIAADIAAEMGLNQQFQQGLMMCGAVHDVGKIAVPAEILSKPSRLSSAEYEIVKLHAEQGYQILKSIELPWPLAEAARQHHERMDGSGYPRGLKGDEILLEARIIAVADVVESMTSHRPYRAGLGQERALKEIEDNTGRLYDPEVAAACLRLFRAKDYVIAQ